MGVNGNWPQKNENDHLPLLYTRLVVVVVMLTKCPLVL